MRELVAGMVVAGSLGLGCLGCSKGKPEGTASSTPGASRPFVSAPLASAPLASASLASAAVPAASIAIDLDKPATWPALELRRVGIELGGMEGQYKDVKLSLLIPTNFELDDTNGPTERQYKPKGWERAGRPVPWIVVIHQFGPPAFEHDLASLTGAADVRVVTKKQDDAGWVLALEDTFTVSVHRSTAVRAEESIMCRGHAFGDEAKGARDAVLEWFEKICRSIVVEQ